MPDIRPLRIKITGLADDAMSLESFKGSETLSQPFKFKLTMTTAPDTKIKFEDLLGQKTLVTLDMPADKAGGAPKSRYFHGLIHRLAQGPQVRSTKDSKPQYRVLMELVPEIWFLKLKVQSRIYQQKTVPEILKDVLTGLETDVSGIQGDFLPREYCTQYRESDFAFASRLMEEEGIYYYFDHTDSGHKMYLANTADGHKDVVNKTTINYDDHGGGQYDDDIISVWEKSQEVRSGKVTLWDYTYEMQKTIPQATKSVAETPAVGTITHKLVVASNTDKFELFDYPGMVAHHFEDISAGGGDQTGKNKTSKIADDATRIVGIRLQQESVQAVMIAAESACRQMSAGHKFTLDKHYDGNGAYVVTRVNHSANLLGTTGGSKASGLGGKLRYENSFVCLPTSIPFRPIQQTPKARIMGLQTAVVVGDADATEIFTDDYGRVKVKFNWDRKETANNTNSCWLRVATPWAGKHWGMIHIPRVGHEVLVAFVEGDPDMPIVVGSLYNFTNLPPYDLDKDNRAKNMTKSGLLTRSTTGAKDDNTKFNELRFDDTKDKEEIYFHAEKDFTRIVENNDYLKIGYPTKDDATSKAKDEDGSQKIIIFKHRSVQLDKGNETFLVSEGDRKVTIDKGKDELFVTKGTRSVTVEKDDTHQIKTGNRTVLVDKGDDKVAVKTGSRIEDINKDFTLTVKTGNHGIKISAGKSSYEAAQSITLKVGGSTIKMEPGAITLTCGASTIKMEPAGITMKAPQIKIAGAGMVDIKGPMASVSGDGMLKLKGGVTMIN